MAWAESWRPHLTALARRRSAVVLRVDPARWGQTPEDLRFLALGAPHPRTRERALALDDVAQGACATRVAAHASWRAQTVRGWGHAYNKRGPDALVYCRTGGRPPLWATIEASLSKAVHEAAGRATAPPLGLEAQCKAVTDFLNGGNWRLVEG